MASVMCIGVSRVSLNRRDSLQCYQQQHSTGSSKSTQARLRRRGVRISHGNDSNIRVVTNRSGRYGALVVSAGGENKTNGEEEPSQTEIIKYNTEFGYSRKDIILIGVGLIGLGYVLYYGLQTVFGMDAAMAGNWVQLVIFLGICVGWIGSYLFRVATKQMTYAKQLDDYEEAVMKKRLEELPDTELENMMQNVEDEKERMRQRRAEREAKDE